MWSYICPELLLAIESEPESDVAAEMYESLGKVNKILIFASIIILKLYSMFQIIVYRIIGTWMFV